MGTPARPCKRYTVSVGTARYGLLELTRGAQPTTLVFTNGREVVGKASREVECKYLPIAVGYPG